MNSFALLEDDVEDADVTINRPKTVEKIEIAVPQPNGDAADNDGSEDSANADGQKELKPEKEKDLTLEEYLAQKASKSSSLASLNNRSRRQANDGADGFKKMSVFKRNESLDTNSIMENVPKKELHENKGLKDSTQAAVLSNAANQKFFMVDPNERRRGNDNMRRGYGDRKGSRGRMDGPRGGRTENARGRNEMTRGRGDYVPRGRGDSGRGRSDYYSRGRGDNFRRSDSGRGRRDGARGGRGRGRGGYRGSRDYNRDASENKMNGGITSVPNVDDVAAFPTLG